MYYAQKIIAFVFIRQFVYCFLRHGVVAVAVVLLLVALLALGILRNTLCPHACFAIGLILLLTLFFVSRF